MMQSSDESIACSSYWMQIKLAFAVGIIRSKPSHMKATHYASKLQTLHWSRYFRKKEAIHENCVKTTSCHDNALMNKDILMFKQKSFLESIFESSEYSLFQGHDDLAEMKFKLLKQVSCYQDLKAHLRNYVEKLNANDDHLNIDFEDSFLSCMKSLIKSLHEVIVKYSYEETSQDLIFMAIKCFVNSTECLEVHNNKQCNFVQQVLIVIEHGCATLSDSILYKVVKSNCNSINMFYCNILYEFLQCVNLQEIIVRQIISWIVLMKEYLNSESNSLCEKLPQTCGINIFTILSNSVFLFGLAESTFISIKNQYFMNGNDVAKTRLNLDKIADFLVKTQTDLETGLIQIGDDFPMFAAYALRLCVILKEIYKSK